MNLPAPPYTAQASHARTAYPSLLATAVLSERLPSFPKTTFLLPKFVFLWMLLSCNLHIVFTVFVAWSFAVFLTLNSRIAQTLSLNAITC